MRKLLQATLTMGLVVLSPQIFAQGGPPVSALGVPSFSDPTSIDNAWFPLPALGETRLRILSDGQGNAEVERVLPGTRTLWFAGQAVECRVVEEIEVEDGTLTEVSENYFAEADDGAVYYFGELVNDLAGTPAEPSWLVGGPSQAGDPASTLAARSPSLFMPGAPSVGDVWLPEYLPPTLWELNRALSVGAPVQWGSSLVLDGLTVFGSSGRPSGELKLFERNRGLVGHIDRDVQLEVVFETP